MKTLTSKETEIICGANCICKYGPDQEVYRAIPEDLLEHFEMSPDFFRVHYRQYDDLSILQCKNTCCAEEKAESWLYGILQDLGDYC